MMKISSCTVLYNPTMDVIDNLSSYCSCVSQCVVVDNSDRNNDISERIKQDNRFIYISNFGNMGIANALNKGIEYLAEKGTDFVLTMDQDSVFPTEDFDAITHEIEKIKGEYSIIGLNLNYYPTAKTNRIIPIKNWITSGNFLDVKDWIRVGGFDERLFIDYVDFEYCHKLYLRGLKVCYFSDYSIEHTIGNPVEFKVFGRIGHSSNHAPIRYYYRYRNSYYLYMQDPNYFKNEFMQEYTKNLLKMLIFEKNRLNKIKMITRGLHDAKKARLGKYSK